MVHCGYEPTAVSQTFGSWRGLAAAARMTLWGPSRQNDPTSDDPVTLDTHTGADAPPVLYQLDSLRPTPRSEPAEATLEARAG
jgi:hypothetical protein